MNPRALVMVEISDAGEEEGPRGARRMLHVDWRRRDGINGSRRLSLEEASGDVERLLVALKGMKPNDELELELELDGKAVAVDVRGGFLSELVSAVEITVARVLAAGASATQRIDLDDDDVVRRGVSCAA